MTIKMTGVDDDDDDKNDGDDYDHAGVHKLMVITSNKYSQQPFTL